MATEEGATQPLYLCIRYVLHNISCKPFLVCISGSAYMLFLHAKPVLGGVRCNINLPSKAKTNQCIEISVNQITIIPGKNDRFERRRTLRIVRHML